jgi:hypothetical protein
MDIFKRISLSSWPVKEKTRLLSKEPGQVAEGGDAQVIVELKPSEEWQPYLVYRTSSRTPNLWHIASARGIMISRIDGSAAGEVLKENMCCHSARLQ